MVRGRMLARADRGTLDTGKGRVLLEGKVRMAGTADEGRFLRFAAPVLAFERNGTMLASGGVAVATADAILRGETVERMPGEKGDLLHAAGDTTVLLVPPSPQRGPLLAAGDSGDLSRDADGFPSAMTLARASGDARLDVGPAGTSGPRRILAPRFEADFSAGRVSVVVAPAGLRGAEAVASDGKGGAGLRTLESAWGRFTFLPGSEDLDVAVFDRGVRLEDGTRSVVLAAKGTLRGPDETAVFSGDAGRPAEYRGENVTVRSRLLTWLRKEDRVEASGNVRTVFRGGTSTGLGGEPGEPYYSESDSLKMATVTRVATLEGNVRAWQKENVLRSTKLVLNDAERSVRAEGNVRSVFRRRATMPGPSSKTARDVSETVTASGDVLTHREAERTVRIEGNAKIVSGAWTMNATVADFRLTKDRAIEGAEARGAVALEDRATSRRGDGSLATWSPATETVTLEGTPATALDGKGNRMTGARLTFRQGQSRVDVESGPGVGSEGSYKPEGP
jgi:lipopolysaccharide export system protein LptA